MATTVPPAIFRAEVVRVVSLTPGLVRITLAGEGLRDFATTGVGDEYLRIFFPHTADRTLVNLPVVSANGGWEFAEDVERAPMRTYTVRAARPGEVDIDFVVHEGGVAAQWALDARVGDVVGLNAPTGLYDPPEDLSWQLLVADQTGLPAVCRILEQTPSHVESRVVLEVPDAEHQLDVGANTSVTWVHGGNGHGQSRLGELVRGAVPTEALATGLEGGYVWVAGETHALRDARRFLRRESGLAATRYKVVGYWTVDAERVRDRYEALDEKIRTELIEMWRDEERDREEIEDEYIERLEKLGL